MSYFEAIRSINYRNFPLSPLISGVFVYSLHVILEFVALKNAGLDFYWISLHLIGVPLGALFYLLTGYQNPRRTRMYYLLLPVIIALSLLVMINTKELIIIATCLLVAGISIGVTMPMSLTNIDEFTEIQYNGRILISSFVFVMLFLWIETIITFNGAIEGQFNILTQFLGVFTVLLLILLVYDRNVVIQQDKYSFRFFLHQVRQLNLSPLYLLSFFVGLFFMNTYYSGIILIEDREITAFTISGTYTYLIVLIASAFLFMVPAGFIYDRLGRRFSIMIGFYLEVVAYFSVAVVPILFNIDVSFVLLYIFPFFTGIGMTLALFGAYIFILNESAPENFKLIHGYTAMLIQGIGMVVGLVIDELLRPILVELPFILPFVMIFAYFTATVVLFQLKETLPPRDELEWKDRLDHVLVMDKSGLPLYVQSFKDEEYDRDRILIGGALVGIASLTQEIYNSTHLKVLRQEGYSIMLEEGAYIMVAILTRQELDIIRSKMIQFVQDFENFFADLLIQGPVVTEAYLPTKQIVRQIFI